MPSGVTITLALPDDELPEITDAGVGLTLLMVATLLNERDRQALHRRLADAVDGRDWAAVAALHRRLAAVPGAVDRMADVARAGVEQYDAGLADPADGPAVHARARRSLIRSANWLERRFWPMYGTVRPVMPPAAVAVAPAATPPPARTKPCRKAMRGRLNLLDGELARIANDARAAAATARLIMLADRNGHAARCRACGGCRLAITPLTRDIPVR